MTIADYRKVNRSPPYMFHILCCILCLFRAAPIHMYATNNKAPLILPLSSAIPRKGANLFLTQVTFLPIHLDNAVIIFISKINKRLE